MQKVLLSSSEVYDERLHFCIDLLQLETQIDSSLY